MLRQILCWLMVMMPVAMADVVVAPPELDAIGAKIAQRQLTDGRMPKEPAKIEYQENRVLFMQPSGEHVMMTFNTKAETLEKHFNLRTADDGYAFMVTLVPDKAKPYSYVVRKLNGMDALFCFNDDDVFVYTQEEDGNGFIALKEWIYVKKPNTSTGSQWSWLFKSEPWQWPLTLKMGENGEGAINRNMPFAGIPIVYKARSQYMLDMMVKFKRDEPIKKYFPYEEKIAGMPKAKATNKEGIEKSVDVNVENQAIDNDGRPRQKVGLDFQKWDDHWHSVYTVRIKAKPNEYPLLIE